MVVDDEPLIRWSITEKLTAHGHAVCQAGNGASALAALEGDAVKPDVILLDYRLPDSNDLQLLHQIRAVAPRAAIIMMTAFGTSEMARQAQDLGAYRVLSKPFDLGELPTLIREAHASSQHRGVRRSTAD